MAQPRPRTSTRTSSRASAPSSSARRPPPAPPAASLPLPSSIRGGEGFYSPSSSAASTSASKRTSTSTREPGKRQVGVPRPPTSSRLRTLRPTVPRSPASSQESLIIVEPSPRAVPGPPRRSTTKRTTTPSVSPTPSRSTTPTPTRSTTPSYDPPPPSSGATATPRRPLPPSCFRPRPPSQPPRPRSPSPELASPSPRKRPRLRPSSTTSPSRVHLAAALVPGLRDTDFAALDPASTYRLSASLLFRAEYLERGAPTFAQGAKRGYGGAAALKWERERAARTAGGGGGARAALEEAARGEVPRWARTDDGHEWEEDVLQRLSSRLAAPTTSTSASAAGNALVPLLFAADVARLRGPVRLGEAGAALECYVVGREWPVRCGVWTGWVVAKEWREKENSWAYAVDDGTDVLEVVCPSSSLSSSSALPGTTAAAQLPLLLPRSSAATSSASSATTSATISPRKALAAAQFAHLEQRSEQQSERVEVREGECVRVVGRIEERRMVWDEGRRVVALRMDILNDVNALSAHHTQTAQLHRTLYAAPFDARARLAQVEQDEVEARQAAWETASCATATTSGTGGGSEWGGRGGGSVASSPGRGTHYRPTRPSKLAREDLTLSNFVIYVRHHLRKRYVVAVPLPGSPSASDWSPPPSSQRSPSSSSPSSSASSSSTNQDAAELALPFTLAAVQANPHLSLFASRLAQEQARLARDKERGIRPAAAGAGARRAWVAPPPMGSGRGAHHMARGSVGMGAARLLPPPSALAASGARRSGPLAAAHESALPLLDGAELERAVARVWREAIRTMRKAGMVVEAEEAAAGSDETVDERGGKQVEEELPDLPRWERGRGAPVLMPQTPRRRGEPGRCGDGEGTPRAAQPAGACPWGDVKLFGPVDEEDEQLDGGDELCTPRASRACADGRAAPPPVTPRRSKAHPPAPTWSASSNTSTSTSSSFTAQAQQSFQLVTAGTLAPLLLTLLSTLFDHRRRPDQRNGAPPPSSVTERDLRVVLHGDERWAAVAQYSEAVGKALEVLAGEGRVERHGLGWRPSGTGRRL
ncbi:hypothetical protein JCM9279_005088 [Rhodotorula babjevae]